VSAHVRTCVRIVPTDARPDAHARMHLRACERQPDRLCAHEARRCSLSWPASWRARGRCPHWARQCPDADASRGGSRRRHGSRGSLLWHVRGRCPRGMDADAPRGGPRAPACASGRALASVARAGISGTRWHQWHALASVARGGNASQASGGRPCRRTRVRGPVAALHVFYPGQARMTRSLRGAPALAGASERW
jgi:hypothetical protein